MGRSTERRSDMLRRELVPVWVAIMVVASMYLMGQGWSPPPPSGPPAPVPKTGQTTVHAFGDDGHLQKGVAWPDPRFTDNGDGTATDNLTGLVWTQNQSCLGSGRVWGDAVNCCNLLADGGCGLSDGSAIGDWRLPNVRELQSLIDYGNHSPALPTGHPFTNTGDWHWTSTSYADNSGYAWNIQMDLGGVVAHSKNTGMNHVGCVRSGQ